MSYGADLREGGRLRGIYAGRILRGESRPTHRPIRQTIIYIADGSVDDNHSTWLPGGSLAADPF